MKLIRNIDINDVCQILGVTSRTLRFYEQKGIIHSTPSQFNNRRQYSEQQIQEIKNVLVLRSLGLPVSKISQIQKGSHTLSEAITEQKAHIIAAISTKAKELNRLEEALCSMENGEDIYFCQNSESTPENIDYARMNIVESCTDAFITGAYEKCFDCFCRTLREYLPLPALKQVCEDTIKPLGSFVCKDKTAIDDSCHNICFSYLKYQNLGLSIKYVFGQNEIHGFWLNYYELKKEIGT